MEIVVRHSRGISPLFALLSSAEFGKTKNDSIPEFVSLCGSSVFVTAVDKALSQTQIEAVERETCSNDGYTNMLFPSSWQRSWRER